MNKEYDWNYLYKKLKKKLKRKPSNSEIHNELIKIIFNNRSKKKDKI